jgi:hypothetical protein
MPHDVVADTKGARNPNSTNFSHADVIVTPIMEADGFAFEFPAIRCATSIRPPFVRSSAIVTIADFGAGWSRTRRSGR